MTRLLTLFVLLGLASAVLMADPAIVINRGTGACGMPGSDVDGNIIFGGIGTATVVVENGNKVMVKCQGTVTNLSDRAQSFEGFTCGVGDGQLTDDSRATVSANGDGTGNGTVTCTFKKP